MPPRRPRTTSPSPSPSPTVSELAPPGNDPVAPGAGIRSDGLMTTLNLCRNEPGALDFYLLGGQPYIPADSPSRLGVVWRRSDHPESGVPIYATETHWRLYPEGYLVALYLRTTERFAVGLCWFDAFVADAEFRDQTMAVQSPSMTLFTGWPFDRGR